MSLNKTLDRLFDEIRREAKRNPDFADRLDAVLRAHASRRDVPEVVVEEIAQEEALAPPPQSDAPPAAPQGRALDLPTLNPAGLYKRRGEEALRTALETQEISVLRALVAEHNLDPGGVTGALSSGELTAHIVAQAKRRAERDEKMFDY